MTVILTRKWGCWVNRRYHIKYVPEKENNRTVFERRLGRRIENFRRMLKDERYCLFVTACFDDMNFFGEQITCDDTHINKLYEVIAEARGGRCLIWLRSVMMINF